MGSDRDNFRIQNWILIYIYIYNVYAYNIVLDTIYSQRIYLDVEELGITNPKWIQMVSLIRFMMINRQVLDALFSETNT